MGAWDIKPWDNDCAADWFDDLFDEVKLREKVIQTLKLDPGSAHEEIRAATTFLIYFGRTYLWPIDHIEDDLKLAIRRLEEIKTHEVYADLADYLSEIDHEIELLKCRLDRDRKISDSPEFHAWWRSHAE